MIFYTVMRLMPAPLGCITVLFLFTSLPAAILINSKKRLGRYCWIWAAIPFVAGVWAGLRTNRYGEEAEAFVLFIFQYPLYWAAYFLLYRLVTRKRAIEILSLTLNEHTAALSAGRDVPKKLPVKTSRNITLGIIVGTVVVALLGLALVTRSQAHAIITHPLAARTLPNKTPADHQLPYEDVTVITADGLHLIGWYIPSVNGALVIAQHGYKSNRAEMLNEAEMLFRHGYGVLLSSVRAHDGSDGEQISFGYREMQDMAAWFQYALTRAEVQPARIGLLGNSMGGSLVVQYAAQNPRVRAVVANSAFSSLKDTVRTSVTHYTGLPPFPFAPLILFWGEQEGRFNASEIDAKKWIPRLSPRPVFLMQGGADKIISAESGELLYAAAGDPKELWYEPSLEHTMFDQVLPQEYERRVIDFLDKYLLGK